LAVGTIDLPEKHLNPDHGQNLLIWEMPYQQVELPFRR
jgi:hypothetical protein